MISFRVQDSKDECLIPFYATSLSVAADLKSAIDVHVPPYGQVRVPTGLWIDTIDDSRIPDGMVVELQVRARSGLAFRHGITLTNGVGTIDADYPDEICVLLWNTRSQGFQIHRNDRIAQICAQLIPRLDVVVMEKTREGGFGSTGL